jgi:signal peptidase II
LKWVALIGAAVVLLDQATKWLALRLVSPEQPVPVIPGFFQLVNWRNTGAAWGILRDYNWLLTLISALTLVALLVFRKSFGIHQRGPAITLGLILGGIAGNLIDRLRWGSVVDFLDFYVGRHHWPAFNVADSAICIGVGLYIIYSWRSASVAQPSA